MYFNPKTILECEPCIEVKCGIPFTPDCIEERFKATQDMSNCDTQSFFERWGEARHARALERIQKDTGRLDP